METFIERYKEVKANALSVAGGEVLSFALVAITKEGDTFYGSDFGYKPEDLLRKLKEIERDVRHYIKTQGSVTGTIGRERSA